MLVLAVSLALAGGAAVAAHPWVALLATLVALAAGVALGHRLGAPARRLATAAARLGDDSAAALAAAMRLSRDQGSR